MARIISNKYPEEDEVARWVLFDNAEEAKISKVFARRLAALARDNNKRIIVSEGLRTYERQLYFYNLYLSGKGNYAAKPDLKNGSQHQYGFAIDWGDPEGFWKSKANKEWMPYSRLNQKTLNKYGLCLPLNNVEMPLKNRENWHVVPIEVYNSNYTGNRCDFLQKDDLILDWDAEMIKVKNIDIVKKEITQIISGFVNKGITTSVGYWTNVLNGTEIARADYLRAIFKKLLN